MNDLLNNLGNYRDIKTIRLVPDDKKVISMRYNTSSQKPRRLMRADLIFMIGVYASFPTETHSQYSKLGVEASRLKIFSDGNLWDDHEDHPSRQKNNQELHNEKEYHQLGLKQSEWKLEQKNDRNFLLVGKELQNK